MTGAALLSTGTVMVTRTAKMAQMRKAVVSGLRPQAFGLGKGEGSIPGAKGRLRSVHAASRRGTFRNQLLG